MDDIRIGTPDFEALSYEELIETRPDAVAHTRWDPLHELGPITPDQQERVAVAERTD